MAKARRKTQWTGSVERYIRKVVVRGREIYRVQIGGAGRGQRRSRLCATLEEAVATKTAWLATAGSAVLAPVDDDPSPVDVESAIRHHARGLRQRDKPDAARRTEQILVGLRAIYPELLALGVEAVTDAHVAAYVAQRRATRVKDNTIVRDLRSLRAALKRARPSFRIASEVFPSENLTRVRILPPDVRREVFPYIAERFGSRFARVAELAMLCVVRLNDLRTLTRDMVHLPERLLLLPRTKGNPPVPRPVRLSGKAVELLRAQLASHEHDYVFAHPRTGEPYTRIHLSRVWRHAARACGLQGFTFHDLRHHAPTVAVNAGANAATLKAMGGWKSDKSVERYASVLAPTVDHYLALAAEAED